MPEQPTKKWLNRGLIVGLSLMLMLMLMIALIGGFLWLKSDSGLAYIESRIEALDVAGQTISIAGLDGSPFSTLKAQSIEVTGPDGVWFVARSIEFDWNPWAMFDKTLMVKRLKIADLDMLQRPVLARDDKDNSDPIVTLYKLNSIELPDIVLSDMVLGRELNLSVLADLSHGPDGGKTRTSLQSEQGDDADLDVSWSPHLVLEGTADIEGPEGGQIAGLLRLRADQKFQASVTTQGSQTDVEARINDVSVASLRIERRQSTVSVRGRVDPDPLPILDRLTPFLGGVTDLDVLMPLDETAPVKFQLSSPKLSANAEGRQSNNEIILETFRVNVEDPLATLDNQPVTIQKLMADGSARLGDDYKFMGRITAHNLTYQDYRVESLSGPSRLIWSDGQLSFDGDLRGQSTGNNPRLDGAKVNVTGSLDNRRSRIQLSKADVFLPGLAVQGRGEVEFADTLETNFSGRYTIDTGVFREGPQAQLSGTAQFSRQASGPALSLKGRATGIQGLPSSVESLTEDGLHYETVLRFKNDAIQISSFSGKNNRVRFAGDGTFQEQTLNLGLDYAIKDYVFETITANDVEGKAQISGPIEALVFDTELTASALNASLLETLSATVTANGQYRPNDLRLTVDLSADSPDGPVKSRASIRLVDNRWTVDDLDASLAALQTRGQLSGIGGDISAIRGNLEITGQTPLIPADRIDVALIFGDRLVDVDLRVSNIDVGPYSGGAMRLLAKGPRNQVAFSLQTEGRAELGGFERSLIANAEGTANLDEAAPAIMASFDMSLDDLTLTGDASAQRISPNQWRAFLNSQGLGGKVSASFDRQEQTRFEIDLDDLSIARLLRLLGRPVVEGTLSGGGAFETVDNRFEGQAQLAIQNLRSPISQSEAISLVSDLSLRNDRLRIEAKAQDGGLSGRALVEGNVSTLATRPYVIFPFFEPLQGRADLTGEIGPVVELFLPPQTDFSGQVETDLTFSIPSTSSDLKGRILLTNAAFEQGALGLNLTDINMTTDLSGDVITVPSLSAKGVRGGMLQGSGQMGLGEGTGTVDIQAEKLRVLSRREGQAEVSGVLKVSRTSDLLRLGGNLRVTDADLNIARLPKPGLPTLAVQFEDVDEEEAGQSLASTTTELDIDLVSEGRIKLRGRGLNASMSLNASVDGSFDKPVVTGRMSVERGRFDFLSKRFEFRDSFITLREDALQSILSLEAVRETPDLTAVVTITGTAERPEIELTSEPNLPEDEVLSRILFGRSPTQLTAIETARLAAALAQLSGGSGFDLFGSLENAIGLDTLEIGQTDAGQTQLTTGKYLSDNVYLEVRSAAEGTPGLAVEWQVRPTVSVEAETVPNERQRLSVQWKKDFD